MGSYSSALASAEVLLDSATNLLIDAASVLHDADDRGGAQECRATWKTAPLATRGIAPLLVAEEPLYGQRTNRGKPVVE